MRLILLVAVSLVLQTASAQETEGSPQPLELNDCAAGTAEGFLDVGDVRAALYSNGGLFWRGSGVTYETPKGTGLTPMFSTSLWVGGLANDSLRFAGSTYGPWEFWPGPLDAVGNTSPEQCAEFDRIWTITTRDLEIYVKSGIASSDLEGWPIAFGAPFYRDLDGDNLQDENELTVTLRPGDPRYDGRPIKLQQGERPVIYGQQTAWWVMNDRGGEHEWSEAEPLGIEVRVTAWSTGLGNTLSQSTFYRYEILNRSDTVLEDVYAGLYVDGDLGDATDDRVHTDSTRQMLVFYNGDELDSGGGGYGSLPPALGIDMLSGSPAAMHIVKNGPGNGEPVGAVETYRYLRGLWRDGTSMRVGGDGHSSDRYPGYDPSAPVTTWAFSGDPVAEAFWSMENVDGNGFSVIPSDKRASISATPATLAPGEHMTFDAGVLFSRAASRLGSVTALRLLSETAQSAYDSGRLFGPYSSSGGPATPSTAPELVSPANGASLSSDNIAFEWTPVPFAEQYRLEIDTVSTFEIPIAVGTTTTETRSEITAGELPRNYSGPLFWRVQTYGGGEFGPPSEVRQFTNVFYRLAFESFEVVANAAGPLVPPAGGAPDFGGFPTPERPGERQQVAEAVWFVAAAGIRSYPEFLDTVSGNSARSRRVGSSDYEIRFTGTSLAAKGGFFEQTGAPVEVPFEIWNIGRGTPADPSDDVRMIPVINDIDGDGTYNLSTLDSPISGSTDDPETDWISWYDPTNTSPGQAGYLAYENGGAVNLGALGLEVMSQTTFVGWNLGTAPPYAAPYPEVGTVFRLITTKPFNVASENEAQTASFDLEVWPNPASSRAEIAFALEAAGRVRLAVYDVLGREVSVLEDGPKTAGEHRTGLEVDGLAPGVYVVVLEGAGERASRTITVVR